MPSSSKSPQAPSTKTHSFLRKSTDESPSFKTTSTSVPSDVRSSQSTNSLSPRSNESNHPEEDDVISDDDKTPEERAANRRRGYDPNSSLDENNTSFLSVVGSSVSSTPSLERAIKKKKVSDSDSDEPSSTQQVVHRKGQPTATPILIYEDFRREVVQQCIANLMSTFHLSLTVRLSRILLPNGLRICCVGFIKLIKPIVIPGEHGAVKSSLNISV